MRGKRCALVRQFGYGFRGYHFHILSGCPGVRCFAQINAISRSGNCPIGDQNPAFQHLARKMFLQGSLRWRSFFFAMFLKVVWHRTLMLVWSFNFPVLGGIPEGRSRRDPGVVGGRAVFFWGRGEVVTMGQVVYSTSNQILGS